MFTDILYICYITLLYYYMPNIGILLLLFTNDNLLISYNNLCDIYKLKYKIVIYEQVYIDRYIYYILLILFKFLMQIILYTFDDNDLKYMILLSTTPTIMSQLLIVCNTYIMTATQFFNKIYTLIVYDMIKYVIKVVCIATINYDPNMTYGEIEYLMGKNHTDNLLAFVRSFLVLSVIQTIANGNSYSLRLLKTIYNNNVAIKYSDPYPTIRSDLKKMKHIIKKRQWEQFCNPHVVQLITKMYNERQMDNRFEIYVKMLENAFAKVFICVTVGKLLQHEINCYAVIAIISYFLSNTTYVDVVVRLIAYLVGYYTDNCYVCAFVCEYSKLLLTIPLQWFYKNATVMVNKNIHLLIHYNEYNYYLIIHLLLCYFPMSIYSYVFILLNSKHPIVTLWFYMGYFSNFSLCHMIMLLVLLYLAFNIYYAKDAKPIPVKMLYITNYITPLSPTLTKAVKTQPLRNILLLNSMYNPINNRMPE